MSPIKHDSFKKAFKEFSRAGPVITVAAGYFEAVNSTEVSAPSRRCQAIILKHIFTAFTFICSNTVV
jgi:hypothetical protein